MQYLVIGLILFIAFATLVVLLLQYAHNQWEEKYGGYLSNTQENSDSSDEKTAEQSEIKIADTADKVNMVVDQIGSNTRNLYEKMVEMIYFGKGKELAQVLNVIKNVYLLCQGFVVNIITSILTAIQPIKHAAIKQEGYTTPTTHSKREKENKNKRGNKPDKYDKSNQEAIKKLEIRLKESKPSDNADNMNNSNNIDNANLVESEELQPSKDNQTQTTTTKSPIGFRMLAKMDNSFEAIEARLINRMGKEDIPDKFLTALELGDLYGREKMQAEQKEIYIWVMEKAEGKIKQLAANKLISVR